MLRDLESWKCANTLKAMWGFLIRMVSSCSPTRILLTNKAHERIPSAQHCNTSRISSRVSSSLGKAVPSLNGF